MTHLFGSDYKENGGTDRSTNGCMFLTIFNRFCLLVQQVEFLLKQRHVYLLPGGCVNVSAINSGNLDYVAESLHLTLTTPL